jgi:hypothetical protein
LINYAGQLAQNNLLPTRLSEKIQKTRWLKPKKTHDRALRRFIISTKAAKQAANKQAANKIKKIAAQPSTPQ